jgi:hypothetical protein
LRGNGLRWVRWALRTLRPAALRGSRPPSIAPQVETHPSTRSSASSGTLYHQLGMSSAIAGHPWRRAGGPPLVVVGVLAGRCLIRPPSRCRRCGA